MGFLKDFFNKGDTKLALGCLALIVAGIVIGLLGVMLGGPIGTALVLTGLAVAVIGGILAAIAFYSF